MPLIEGAAFSALPEFAGSIVVMLLVLGFFPALIFAWVYEMTPEGLKREVDVDRSRSQTPETGKKIGSYRIGERIGGGSMGRVWRGVDEALGRPVAVKMLRSELAESPGKVSNGCIS